MKKTNENISHDHLCSTAMLNSPHSLQYKHILTAEHSANI